MEGYLILRSLQGAIRWLVITVCLFSLTAGMAPAGLLPAVNHLPEMNLSPGAVRPGGQVQALGSGLISDWTYFLLGLCFNDSAELYLNSDSRGFLQVSLLIDPGFTAPGSCTVELWQTGGAGAVLIESRVLAILDPMTLSLEPMTGQPGSQVSFTARNLVPGSLRLDYAGIPVLGPLEISGSSWPPPTIPLTYTGSFTIPLDRPNPPDSLVPVEAFNLAGGAIAAYARAEFQSQAPPPPPDYAFSSMDILTTTLVAGAPFTLTGKIDPPPTIPMVLGAMYQDGDGQTFPVGDGAGELRPDGSFTLAGHIPGILFGDPRDPGPQGKSGKVVLMAFGQGGEAIKNSPEISLVMPQAALDIEVKGTDGIPIDQAIVQIVGAPGLNISAFGYGDTETQLSQWARDHGYQNFCGEYGGINSGSGGLTRVDGVFKAAFDPLGPYVNPIDSSAFSGMPLFLPAADSPTLTPAGERRAQQEQTLAMVTSPSRARQPQAHPGKTPLPDWLPYVLVVDAMDAGYAEIYHNYPRVTLRYIEYNPALEYWRDEHGQALPDPYTILIPPIPETITTITILPKLSVDNGLWGFKEYAGDPHVSIGRVYASLGFKLHPFAALKVDQVRFTSPSGEQKTARPTAYAGCNGEIKDVSAGFYLDLKSFYPGSHNFRIEVFKKDGSVISADVPVQFQRVPDWFREVPQDQREAQNVSGGVQIKGIRLKQDEDTFQVGSTAAETPATGAMSNQMGVDLLQTELLKADNTSSAYSAGGIQVTAINQAAEYQKFFSSGGGSALEHKIARLELQEADRRYHPRMMDNGEIPLFKDRYELFNSGYQPLFLVFIPVLGPLVTVSVGGGMQFSAGLSYQGSIHLSNPAGYSLTVTPDATLAVDTWMDASVLLHLAGYGKSQILLNIGLNMPVTFEDGSITDSGVCFSYYGTFSFEIGAVCIPFTDRCLYNKRTTYPLFNHPCSTDNACNPGSNTESEPLQMHPALAADQRGQALALFPAGKRSLQASMNDGLGWSSPLTISTGLAPLDPQAAFFAPDTALAAWAESSLAVDPTPTTPFTDVLKSYHLAFSIWDGAAWSAAQDLTSPTSGDGEVHLAACPGWDAQCPPGGAVTAVWTHDRVGSASQGRYSLRYAIFHNGTWTEAAPVDPADLHFDGADVQPQAVYLLMNPGDTQKQPLVAWIRDADRNPDTLDDRRLAMYWPQQECGIIIMCPKVSLPASLPGRIAEFSLDAGPGDTARIAFTRVPDEAALLDIRHILYSAEAGIPANLQWTYQALQDVHGREIFAERPVLTTDSAGRSTITFRGLGFAPNANGTALLYPEDMPGMRQRSGELVQAEVNFNQPTVGLLYLSHDGQVNWNQAAVYDPVHDRIVTVGLRGLFPIQPAVQGVQEGRALAPGEAAPDALLMVSTGRLPDFELVSAAPANPYPQPGPVTVTVQVRNNALEWQGTLTRTLDLAATWDKPYGSGTPAGEASLTGLRSGETLTVTMALSQPVNLDIAHRLFIYANPKQTIAEQSATNNSLDIQVGGLPPPLNVEAATRKGQPQVFLKWMPLDDPRLAGYRIYRAQDGGPLQAVGSTFVAGFVDLTSQAGVDYTYAVTSFNQPGFESRLSSLVYITPASYYFYLPAAPVH